MKANPACRKGFLEKEQPRFTRGLHRSLAGRSGAGALLSPSQHPRINFVPIQTTVPTLTTENRTAAHQRAGAPTPRERPQILFGSHSLKHATRGGTRLWQISLDSHRSEEPRPTGRTPHSLGLTKDRGGNDEIVDACTTDPAYAL